MGKMNTEEIITIVIAGWGAILSTLLVIREFKKERRELTITLYSIHWTERHKITITNTGHRPITIIEIGLEIAPDLKGPHLPVRSGALFASEEGYLPPRLPLILSDGQTAEFHLSEYVTEQLSNKENHPFIFVYDSEGNVYKKHKSAEYDPRYAYIKKK
jgi:hypothetical protein